MGRMVLVVAIGVGLAGVAAVALSEAGAISSDTSADIVVVSLAATVAIVVVGFVPTATLSSCA
jgi:branched-subunit amino acid ABC-type transport system permease component